MSAPAVDEAAGRKSAAFVAVLTMLFLGSAGYFMVTPLLALDLTVVLHVAVAVSGLLVGAYVFVSQAMQVAAGALITRYGVVPVLLVSAAMSMAGYLLLAAAGGTAGAAAAIVLAATGTGSRTVGMKVFVTSLWRRDGVRALTLRSLVVNVSAAIGPFLGVLLLKEFRAVLLAAALTNIPVMVLAPMLRRHITGHTSGAADTSWRKAFGGIWTLIRHPLLRYSIAGSVGFWLLYAQLSLTVPLYVHSTYHSALILSSMFLLNAVLAALVQGSMLKRLADKPDIPRLLALGMFVTGASFLPLLLRLHGAEIFVFVALFTLGEAIVVPMLDAAAGQAAGWSGSTGNAFGLVAVGWAIGGLIGNDLGGALFSVTAQHGRLYLLWLGFCLVGCCSAVLVARARLTVT
jgi:MFS transporter, DHA1 family, multidrug resistance protein